MRFILNENKTKTIDFLSIEELKLLLPQDNAKRAILENYYERLKIYNSQTGEICENVLNYFQQIKNSEDLDKILTYEEFLKYLKVIEGFMNFSRYKESSDRFYMTLKTIIEYNGNISVKNALLQSSNFDKIDIQKFITWMLINSHQLLSYYKFINICQFIKDYNINKTILKDDDFLEVVKIIKDKNPQCKNMSDDYVLDVIRNGIAHVSLTDF